MNVYNHNTFFPLVRFNPEDIIYKVNTALHTDYQTTNFEFKHEETIDRQDLLNRKVRVWLALEKLRGQFRPRHGACIILRPMHIRREARQQTYKSNQGKQNAKNSSRPTLEKLLCMQGAYRQDYQQNCSSS
ncbi:hypothetical protein V6N13_128480 [Hibiscus sabdariffa]